MFGAVGGYVVANEGDAFGSVLAGTDYVDALTTNPSLVDPATLTDFAGTSAYINGFGGDDLIYGTDKADTLIGGAGDDLLYSLVSTVNSGPGVDPEILTGGGGNDTLYGGGSAGQFDAGDGTDTFAVLYLDSNPALQLEVDLVAGYAAEKTAPDDTTAPAGDTPPFIGTGPDKVINNYALTGFENAIGGPLNDWIRGASGSVIEGGPGADYLDAKAGGVTITYAGSATGVNVLLDDAGSSASGGDAQGDVIGYATTKDVAQLIGTAGNDTLGGYTSDTLEDGGQGFVMRGGGGEDVFTILGFDGSGVYVLPDFTFTPGETGCHRSPPDRRHLHGAGDDGRRHGHRHERGRRIARPADRRSRLRRHAAWIRLPVRHADLRHGTGAAGRYRPRRRRRRRPDHRQCGARHPAGPGRRRPDLRSPRRRPDRRRCRERHAVRRRGERPHRLGGGQRAACGGQGDDGSRVRTERTSFAAVPDGTSCRAARATTPLRRSRRRHAGWRAGHRPIARSPWRRQFHVAPR